MTSHKQIMTSLLIFQFMANLKPSRNEIPEAETVELTFSLKVTFYLRKTKLNYICVCTKFQVSSLILTSFRQGEGNVLPNPHLKKEPLKSPLNPSPQNFKANVRTPTLHIKKLNQKLLASWPHCHYHHRNCYLQKISKIAQMAAGTRLF